MLQQKKQQQKSIQIIELQSANKFSNRNKIVSDLSYSGIQVSVVVERET